MNYFLPFLAVVLGWSVVTFLKPASQRYTKLLLSFSGAYLLALTVFVLIPEVYHQHDDPLDFKYIGLFVIVGVLLQIVLEFFSHGAEHGHPGHLHTAHTAFPLSHGHNHDLVYGIFVHKLPVAIVLTTFFVNSGINKWKTALFLLFFSLMTPLGTYLSTNVPQLIAYHTELSAIVIGIFLHISTVILFENAEGHRFNLLKFLSVCIGFAVAYFT